MSALPTAVRRPQSAPAPSRRPDLRVVQPQPRTWPYLVVVVLLVVGGVFGVLTLSALAAESAFAARELSSEIDALSVRYDELTAEVAHLESPERIRSVAMTQLGMVQAEGQAFLQVERRDRSSAAPARDDGDPPHDPLKASANAQAAGAGG